MPKIYDNIENFLTAGLADIHVEDNTLKAFIKLLIQF